MSRRIRARKAAAAVMATAATAAGPPLPLPPHGGRMAGRRPTNS